MSTSSTRSRRPYAVVVLLTAIVVAGVMAWAIGPSAPAPAAAVLPASPLVHGIPTSQPAPRAAAWPDPLRPEIAPAALTDQDVNRAIRHGVDFLMGHFQDGRLALGDDPALDRTWRDGLDALCVYALLRAGQATRDERLDRHGRFVAGMLDRLDAEGLDTDLNGKWGPVTYGRALRAMALAVYDRPEDRATMQDDAAWLVGAEVLGGYFYDDRYAQGHARQSDLPDAPRQSEKPRPVQPGDVQIPMRPTGVKEDQPKPQPQVPSIWKQPQLNWPLPPQWLLHRPVVVPPPPPPGGLPRSTTPPPPPSVKTPASPSRSRQPTAQPLDPVSLARPLGPDRDPPLTREQVPWDNSNSQYGMLGVLACAECGIEIPTWYWKDVDYHWRRWQMSDGGWAYRATDQASTQAMTAAGVTAVMASLDWSRPAVGAELFGRDPFGPSVAAGIAWLERADNSVAVGAAGSRFVSYDLFNMERAGLATGFKYFGQHAWYRELAAGVLARQRADGSWGGADGTRRGAQDDLIETAYALLFLARGQHPVLFNKLRFDGNWANRYHDAENLAAYASRELERGINWQVVGVERDWTDWLDSPVLYVASQQAPKLTDADRAKLRQFAEAGGVIFTHADGGSAAVNQWVAQLTKKLWPDYPLRPLAEDHPIYSVLTKLAGQAHPKLEGVSNGSRLLLVHSATDLAGTWEMRASRTRPLPFQMGVNLYLYATGKAEPGTRLDGSFLPAPTEAARRTVKVARLKYRGNWDPEPLAWTRFSRWLQGRAGVAVAGVDVDVAALRPDVAPVAHLTATDKVSLDASEAAALRGYVEAGGVLLIDPCGGAEAVGRSLRKDVCDAVFGGAHFDRVSPVRMGLPEPAYRGYVLATKGGPPAQMPMWTAAAGKGRVYLSEVDVTSGLLGTPAWGIEGFESEYASALVMKLLVNDQP